jgi:ferredoxin
MPYIVTDACLLCGACVAGCESNAISEGESQSHIDPDLCVECGTCARNCPSDAIIYVAEVTTDARARVEPEGQPKPHPDPEAPS